MRKQLNEWKHLVILGVLLSCFISKAQQITHQVTFNLNDVEINTVNGYEMVHLKSSGLAESENTAGEPQLPIVSVNLLLPEDAVATSVSITTTQETQITGSFTIYPVQLPAIPNFTEAPEFKVHDPVIYGSNDPFPQNLLVDFSTLGYRNYSIVEISYVPFRYLPLSGQLYLQNNITISVSYTVSPNEEPYQKRSAGEAGKMAWQYVTSLVANYSEAESFYPEAENDPEFDVLFDNIFETTDLPSLEGSRVEYVIITNDTDIHGNNVGGLTDIFQGFADWKTQMGMPAKVVTVDAIRSAYPGVDVQEKIRKFIQEAHQLWGTEYVLLGGNASIVPVRWVKHSFEMPTDLYYSAIYHPTLGYNDNWNANGNNIFGQNTLNNAAPDFADYMPDIAVGRAPISTEAEAELFLNKNFTYANSSGAWLGKTLLGYGGAFNYNWNSSCALRIAHDIVQEHYTNTNLHAIFEYVEDRANYPMNDPASWCRAYYNPFYMYGNNVCTENSVVIFDEKMTHPNMLAQISAGYGIINVLDHAGPYSMGIGSITHLPALTMNDFQDLSTI